TSDNKEAWGIDRGESALACGEEVPDAPEEDKSTGDGEDGGADGGEPDILHCPEAYSRYRDLHILPLSLADSTDK
ncbi:MAG: hypothetical protein M3P18_09025, partial [Actinomycetota bacterium]|nr:hypothetical protein [Actinomycetota bacterium]